MARKKPHKTVAITCSGCRKSHDSRPLKGGEPGLPNGWHRLGSEVFCGPCWKRRYILRAIALPVVRPVGAEWPELDEALRQGWILCRTAANRAVSALLQAETVPGPEADRLPPRPRVYLYGLLKGYFPTLPKQTLASVLRTVEISYRRTREQVILRGTASARCYRYPVPFPVHNQSWSASWEEVAEGGGRVPLVSVPLLAGKEGSRFTLQLRTGGNFHRQLRAFGLIVEGRAVQGELALYRQRIGGDSAQVVEARSPGGGAPARYRVMCKMVAWLPREKPGAREHTLLLRTDPEAFWAAELEHRQKAGVPGLHPWILNADHMVRLCAQVRDWPLRHQAYLQRMSEDLKYEKRWPARVRRRMVEALQRRCDKHHARMTSFCQQAASVLTEYAKRQRVARVIYDDSNRSYVSPFPWHRLAVALCQRLDAVGIEMAGGISNGNEADEGE